MPGFLSAMQAIPDPRQLYPLPGHRRVMFINNFDLPANVSIGDYTYYDDPAGPDAFIANLRYHFDFIGDRLVIGKFCAIATGVQFFMNGGNHRVDAFSSFPFLIFGGAWQGRFAQENDFPMKGDTVVGNDVWRGSDATLMPGITVGDGAIVAAKSVVATDVPPYAIVAGNPARIIRMRFSDEVIATLMSLKWWDWPVEKITAHLPAISGTDVAALMALGDGHSHA